MLHTQFNFLMREDRLPQSRGKKKSDLRSPAIGNRTCNRTCEERDNATVTKRLLCDRFLLVDETMVFQMVSECLNSGVDNFNYAETQYSGLCYNFYGVSVY